MSINNDQYKQLLLDFMGYAITVRMQNQPEWMTGFVKLTNKTLAVIGDDTRFEYNKRDDLIKKKAS